MLHTIHIFFEKKNSRIGTIDLHRENMKKKRREVEQASLDAASDLLDTDSNATFAMVCDFDTLKVFVIEITD